MAQEKQKYNTQILKDDSEDPTEAPPVPTIAMEEHLQMYTSLNLCELACDFNGDEAFAEDPIEEEDALSFDGEEVGV